MTMMTKECEICGTIFETTNSLRKYCDECGANPERARKRLDRAVMINKHNAGDWYKVYNCTCVQCGKTFRSTYANQKFCSEQCKKQHNVETAKCSYCGKLMLNVGIRIEYQGGWHYCSAECKEKARWKAARERGHVQTCAYCGKEFIRAQGTFCCKEHYKKAVAEGWKTPQPKKVRHVKMENVRCPICKKVFTRPEGSLLLFCSSDCAKKSAERRKTEQKKKEAAAKVKKMGICWCCKTPYSNCERMNSNFQYSPKGAVFNDGKVMQCPKYTA